MKKIFTILLVFSICTNVQAQSQFIHVSGKDIIGPDGKNFLMKGTNLGNWLVPEGYMFKFTNTNSPRLIQQTLNELIGPDEANAFWEKYLDSYVTEADIHYLKSTGMNSIRVPFNYRLFTEDTYLGGHGKARAFALLDRLIGWCKKENLYALLDMHCAPGGQTGDNIDDGDGYPFLFDNEKSQDLAAQIWKEIAAHYKNETIIIGYDLLNEPIAHYFDASHFNPLLEPVYKKIVAAVREVDPNHIVFLGGAQWDSNFKIFGQPFDKQAVYTFHKYWTPVKQEVIQEYIDFRNKYNVPIYCGETGENNDSWVMDFRKLLEQNNIGWHYWPYKKMNNTAGIITFDTPVGYQEIILYADTAKVNFEAIRKFRPKDINAVKKALDGFLDNSQFKNCKPNVGYISALGLNAGK
ncbi:MAG: cellulase family glycosylhydrolase [Bacteroidetes bacterium]|nr:cellulase family glycosylhydrolase [Bacteroidota bacterium]